ncbi:ureidoglycolate lyase [Roseicitreum antarcticum]|uniref:Ureidoglycolate lyase n=1 Tax=Roseicitreum antarcticum TaxID=564137 RepID=A0A1H3D2Z6_9RHOB|nr:ureidoglycolate lyase [Roseicitreum antarcticum]SDX60029.1 ureidoglycolate lyase [Roseicitreum antarcticum]
MKAKIESRAVSRAAPLVRRLRLVSADATAFAPFGSFVTPPDQPGERAFYSDAFTGAPADSAAVVHVNNVVASELPLEVRRIERHAHAAQCFIPLDVAHYLVMVMPSDPAGDPDPDGAIAFELPGTTGVIYAPGVWHLGATVIGRNGHFVVTMWRGGAQADDEFRDIDPILLTC